MANQVKPIANVRFRPSTPRTRRNGRPAPERAPLLVGRSPIPTATGIAHRLGWIEREAALDATLIAVLGDPLATPPHLGGNGPLRAAASPGLLREGESVAALWERSRGAQTALIGLTWVDGFQAVVTLPGSGIGEPAQLAGRRIGIPRDAGAPIDARRATARRGVHATLALAGLFPDEAAEVDVCAAPHDPVDPYASELAALQRGEVDAIHLAGAAGWVAAERIGAVPVAHLGRHLDPLVRSGPTTPAAITVDVALLEQQPLLVVRLLAVLLRAGMAAHANPLRAARLVAAETGTTSEDVVAAYGPAFHERLQVDLSEHKLAALAAQRDFLQTHGFLEGDVDIAAWVDRRPLAMARELLAAERTAYV